MKEGINEHRLLIPSYSDQLQNISVEPSVKWKCGVPVKRFFKNFRIVTTEL